jgi:vacuolar-type H+-ATPase subunit H
VGGKRGTTPLGAVTPEAIAAARPNVLSPALSAPKANISPLDRPKIVLPSDTSSLSVGDLIQVIQAEIQKTSEALATAQNSQIKQDSLKQQAANTSQIAALKDAANQIVEIQEQQKAMEIAQWCMTAFSIFMTVCTAGSLGVVFGPLMVAATVVTQVPIEGKNFSGWLSQGVGEGVGGLQKAMLKQMLEDRGIEPTPEAMDKMNKEIEGNQDYYAMAIMITLEVTVAIVIAIASFGAAAAPAAGGAAEGIAQEGTSAAINIATEIAETTLKEAADVATKTAETAIKETTEVIQKAAQTAVQQAENLVEQTVQESTSQATNIVSETVQQTAKEATDITTKAAKTTLETAEKAANTATQTASEGAQQLARAQKVISLGQTIGTTAKDLALDGVNIHTAVLQYENSENLANADKVKGYVKFLQQILKADQEFLKELIDMQANIADTTKGILQTEHATNMHIANLTTHA